MDQSYHQPPLSPVPPAYNPQMSATPPAYSVENPPMQQQAMTAPYYAQPVATPPLQAAAHFGPAPAAMYPAPQQPMAVQPQQPMVVQPPQPVIVQAPQQPVIVQPPQQPVIVQAPQQPVVVIKEQPTASIVQHSIVHTGGGALAKTSTTTVCSTCHRQVRTNISKSLNAEAWICCVLLCLFGCELCFWIPFVVDRNYTVKHTCPNCNSYLGTA